MSTFDPYKELTIKLLPRKDGGLRVWCVELPGLILSGPDPEKVMGAVVSALKALIQHRADGQTGKE
jgi:hypothetical protein